MVASASRKANYIGFPARVGVSNINNNNNEIKY